MRKYLLIMSLAMVFIACSKSDDGSGQEEAPKVMGETFTATIKDGFTGDNGEELILHKSLKNILVGDYIPYTITIKEKEASPNGKYVLIPTKTSDKNHQSLQVDYEMYLENEKGEKEKVGNPYIVLRRAGKYKFYIKPLVPGTFKIPFTLLKEKEGEKTEQTTFPTVNFNAVKITFLRDNMRTGYKKFGIISYSNYYTYRFKMEDGENETDIYLSLSNLFRQTFTIKYKDLRCQVNGIPTEIGK